MVDAMTGFDSKRRMAADKLHWSDCAVNNGPAYPAGPCDCGVEQEPANYLHAVLSAFGPDEGILLDQKGWSQLHAAIKAALAQPAQEPVAWMYKDIYQGEHVTLFKPRFNSLPLYTAPPAAQPAQEPPSEWASIKAILDEYGLQSIDFVADFKAALAGREWNFCERCGKRTPDLTTIHTCTPPQENT
jgi:hypothetical protein